MTVTPNRQFRVSPLTAAQSGLGWWHRAVRWTRSRGANGNGIKIGVIDTGCGPHPALSHVQALGTFIDNEHTEGIDDDGEHGSHVCGIIAARPSSWERFIGMAPEAEIIVARVSRPGRYANQANIADALDAMVDRGVHLVNLSLAASEPSRSLIDSIANAWIHGVVCFAAAGNLGGDVLWPAKHELVVAVTALGRTAEVSEGSLGHLLLEGCGNLDNTNDFVFPNFCSRGPSVNCCAPGVGIISTLRTTDRSSPGHWGDMSGTSMASPLALGVLAAVLSSDLEFVNMPSDESRAKHAVEVLRNQCMPLALNEDCQGDGLPMLDLGFQARAERFCHWQFGAIEVKYKE